MLTLHFASLRRAPLRLGGGLALAAMLVTGIASADKVDDDQFREDVLTCEEAVAHLVSCCPSFDATTVLCDYYYSYSSGCGTTTTRHIDPALTRGDSICIRQRSCAALRDQGVCERAEEATRREQTSYSSSSSSSSSSSGGVLGGGSSSSSSSSSSGDGRKHPRVCP